VVELRVHGFKDIAETVFLFQWVAKAFFKNGKLWYNDFRNSDSIKLFTLIGVVIIGSFNYAHWRTERPQES
jgi:hypothetical protein